MKYFLGFGVEGVDGVQLLLRMKTSNFFPNFFCFPCRWTYFTKAYSNNRAIIKSNGSTGRATSLVFFSNGYIYVASFSALHGGLFSYNGTLQDYRALWSFFPISFDIEPTVDLKFHFYSLNKKGLHSTA